MSLASLLVLLLSSEMPSTSGLLLLDTTGKPVSGASVLSSNCVSFSDGDGRLAPAPPPGDSIAVHALGYLDWKGIMPASRVIVLIPSPLQSGVSISVTARRPGAASSGLSAAVVDRGDIESTAGMGIHSLETRSPGITIREYGGAIPVLSVSVRGSDPSQVGWSIDGHRIRSTMDGGPSVSFMPELFGSIRLARGGGSSFTDGGLAGTIELETEALGAPSRLVLGADSRGGKWLCGAGALGNLLRLSFSASRPVGPQGADGVAEGFLAASTFGGFGAGMLVTTTKGDAESPDWSLPTDAVLRRDAVETWIAVDAGRFGLDAGCHIGQIGYISTFPDSIDDSHAESSAELAADLVLFEKPVSITLTSDIRGELVSGSALGRHCRVLGAAGIRASASLQSLLFGLAVRGEAASDEEIRPGLLGSIAMPLTQSVLIEASVSRSFRRPTFNELYWPNDPFAEGNPELEPERSTEGNLAVRFLGGGAEATVSAYAAASDDLILWAQSADGTWRPSNITRAGRTGLEFLAESGFGTVSFGGSLSLQEIVDLTDNSSNKGNMLPYRPGLSFGCWTSLELGSSRLEVSLTRTGKRYENAANTIFLEPYELLGAVAETVIPGLECLSLAVSGSNILDEEYEEANGYPGRSAAFRVEIRWEGMN